MADVTELRCWPSCIDALDWSQDNIIALASDERIELLFPNTVSYERDNDVPQWQHAPLQVPWFSNDELPLKDTAPLPNFSIGEEISPSVPIAIAWSPPGLAKNRRCALAVLTSNLVLSIWSAEGKPQDESSWNRRLQINEAMATYFSSGMTTQNSHVVSDEKGQTRLRNRIRAFAWAPAWPGNSHTMGTQTSYGQQCLVVSNDDNQLVFLVVDSPTSTLGSVQAWNSRVLTHMSLEPEADSTFTDSLFFDDLIKQQRFISHVAWSPWIKRDGYHQSIVVYATNEEVRGRVVMWSNGHFSLGAEVVYVGTSLRYNGPISWCPRVEEDNTLKLALFTSSGLIYLTISGEDATIVDQLSHDLDCRWDQVSAVVWDCEKQPSARLHFSSLLSTIQSPTAVVEKAAGTLVNAKAPNWKEKVENSMVLFSVKNELKGYSKTKIWGLTSSPLGNFMASCHSLHPSDSIEYGPPADRRGTVTLSTLRQYSKMRESFPAQNTTAEGILFTLKKLVENTVEDADQMPVFAEEMVAKLMQAYGPIAPSESDSIAIAGPKELEQLVTNLKINAVFNEHTLRDRYSILAAYACNEKSPNELARTLIAYRLAKAIQQLPPVLSQTPFSAEILLQHKHLLSLIDTLLGPESHITTANAPAETSPSDQCDFCTAPIPFTDLTSASCTSGHRFPRCGLSFLAIQAPAITKFCGICNTQFLSEAFVRAQEAQEGVVDMPVSLARVLFLACDVCVYCGGKFVG